MLKYGEIECRFCLLIEGIDGVVLHQAFFDEFVSGDAWYDWHSYSYCDLKTMLHTLQFFDFNHDTFVMIVLDIVYIFSTF